MESTSLKHIQHLYWRAGFGINLSEANKLTSLSKDKIVKQLFQITKHEDLQVVKKDTVPTDIKKLPAQEKKELRKERREYGELLNTTWLKQLATTNNPLLEKLTLFWHGHFACRIENIYFVQELNNIQRKYALGNFKDLLLAVSKSPAMLQFLNNQQNRKMHPNENFARELMELFTIGRGNYTEQDIKESARAFTGWGFNKDTFEFEFREKLHDEDRKTFFGQSGNYTGTDTIAIILSDKRTATFLCRKIYRFFVNDTPDESLVSELSSFYFNNDYNTEKLLHRIFTSDWFYDEKNIGKNIKSPIEFIAGLSRTFNIQYNSNKILLDVQKGLGQVLFYPPNVAGWAGGKSWIDSSTLMLRLKLPSMILNGGVIDFEAQGDDPDAFKMMEMNTKNQEKVKERVNTTIDWAAVLSAFPKDVTKSDVADALLQPIINDIQKDFLVSPTNDSLKNLLVQLVSMPEYQMC